MTDRAPFVEIDTMWLNVLTFSPDSEHLIGGGHYSVTIWQMDSDGKQMATMTTHASQAVCGLAVSKDGLWIAAAADKTLIIWEAETNTPIVTHREPDCVYALDFSPDSKKLVVSTHGTAFVWDILTHRRVVSLGIGDMNPYLSWPAYYGGVRVGATAVTAVKYSPQGDQIAVATENSVRVFASDNGRLLLDIPVKVIPWLNTGLLWFDDYLFVISDNTIQKINVSTGRVDLEWSAPDTKRDSCIALSRHGEFIAYSTDRTIIFLDMSSHSELGLIRHPEGISSIALSPDARFIAIAGEFGKTTVKHLSRITEPEIQIEDAALDSWKRNQLSDADELFTAAIITSHGPMYQVLACRSLVRTRLEQWDTAIQDARESIRFRPSVIGYIAQSIALIGKGKRHEAYRACEIAVEQCHSTFVSFILLMKTLIVFMAGEHDDAISRMDDLIATMHLNSACYMIQAHMYLILGNSCMESSNYDQAIQSFENALGLLRGHKGRLLSLVSLIFGWNFDVLHVVIRQRLCEALYAAGRKIEGGESLLEMVNAFHTEIYKEAAVAKWVSDFANKCHSPEGEDGTTLKFLSVWAKAKLACGPWKDILSDTVGFPSQRCKIYQVICEGLKDTDRVLDSSECFQKMESELEAETDVDVEHAKWVLGEDFKRGCGGRLEGIGDTAFTKEKHDAAITHYSAALSLGPENRGEILIKRSKACMAMGAWEDALADANQVIEFDPSSSWTYETILKEWAKVNLTNGLWKGALSATCNFKVPKLKIYRTLCQGLEALGVKDASECFHKMMSELDEATMQGEGAEWVHDFRYRCSAALERLGDLAMNGQESEEAIKHYAIALSIQPADTPGFFIVRSKTSMTKKLWEDALNDANEAIVLDVSSPRGYETKYAALYGARRFGDAIHAFETMLSKMEQSPDPQIRVRRDQYVNPSTTRAVIRKIVHRMTRRLPRVLINTSTGLLLNRADQVPTFMSLPIVNELVLSMTTRIDRRRIQDAVRHHFRYVMLSHKWEDNEPLFQHVIAMSIYKLDDTSTHDKLKKFCEIVRDAGFEWAWSDTCCINKQDHFVLQEALVAMFRWYRHASIVVVFLRGVRSPAKPGDLAGSVWNTRAWTLQEYIAAKVILFYTEDWTLYLDLNIPNHKDAPEIISEMEKATKAPEMEADMGVSAQQLMALRPGLSYIREKLCLASTRETTLVEDAAYSLLGIFSVSGISAIYGEGNGALGRLLAHILTVSGDARILAWTGQSSSYNSCLPAHIAVFKHSAAPLIPRSIGDAGLNTIVRTLRTSALDRELALGLYDRLDELPAPWFAASRMKLPCIAFKLPPLTHRRTSAGHLYRATTPAFGIVEIKTRQDLTRLHSLYLVHPWLDSLLNRADTPGGGIVEDVVEETFSDDDGESDGPIEDSISSLPDTTTRASRSPAPGVRTARPLTREARALQLVARLRQPFGALLFTLASVHRRTVEYRRVAADSMVTVRIREDFPLEELSENVLILDVL